MITHDSIFEDLAKAPVKQSDVIVARKFTDAFGNVNDDGIITWSSSDILMEVKIDSVGKILGSATKKAVVKLMGIVDGFEEKNVFQIRLGLYNNDPYVSGFSYISEGFYLVDTIDYDYDAGSTTITMYDYMWEASRLKYSQSVPANTITYPVTIQAFAEKIAYILGVTLDAGFSSLPNYNYSITQDLYSEISGATVATAIQDIAGATGTIARFTDNVLVFAPYSIASDNLTSNELKKLKIGETYGPITSVVLGRTPQNDNITIFATAPASSTVTSVDTSTNLFTMTGHAMSDGNMVQITSTGTLPSPLVEHEEYYVYTNGQANTFALAPTYNDSIAGSNIIDITTTGSGTISIPSLASREIQINNNEILDDDRQSLITPIYNVLSGIDWTDVRSDTVGLGWYEVGDVIRFTQGAKTVNAWLSEIHLTLSGAVKEQLISISPEVAAINYAAAGGIQASIYNTEIKVDKQGQTITSIVSRQDTVEGQINETLTQINQDIDDIVVTVQKAGGGNILLNSVGYAIDQGQDDDGVDYARLIAWDYPASYAIADHGAVTSYDSSESQNYGGVSGRVVQMSTDYLAAKTVYIQQRVNVAVGEPLSFGMRAYLEATKGEAVVTLSNDNETFTFTIDDSTTHTWEEFSIINFYVTQPWLDVRVSATAESFRFTDLRLFYGATLQGWVQSNGEILAANVQFSKDGMRIFDSLHDTETRVTYNEFSTRRRSDNKVLFEADDTGVVTNDISINGATTYYDKSGTAMYKQITIPNSSNLAGIAWVRLT